MDESLGYDETPYPSAPYPYSHCDHLAAVARLFGIDGAPVERCRVLEVGSADGANLIPMALTLGDSFFVGIDLSALQIDAGRELVARLGLKNIELRRQDLSGFDDVGAFDYIIAHGVYSWTSPDVQTRLLKLCRQSLTPRGVAFVSYNVYPGWQPRRILREWLLRATPSGGETSHRMQQSRRLLAGLGQTLAAHGGEDQRALAGELARLQQWNDGYLRHDLLEDHNEPLLFTDFVERVEAQGLRFFAEADVASMAGAGLPPELYAGLQRLGGSLVGREQLLDLVTNRAFRQSLLCRAECQPRASIDTQAVRSMYIISTFSAAGESGGANTPTRFQSRGGFGIDVSEPFIAATLVRLQQAWPSGAWFKDLIGAANDRGWNQEMFEQQAGLLANVLLAGFVERAVELHTLEPAATNSIDPFPTASPLARLQAATSPLVTNLRHDVVRLDPAAQQFLTHLDGTRSRESLADLASSGEDPQERTEQVERILAVLARASLLAKFTLQRGEEQ